MGEPQFLKAQVVIPVSDIYKTTAWYERVLGFETRYIHGSGRRGETEDFANYAILGRDAVEVHFIMDEGGRCGPAPAPATCTSGCAMWRRSTPA